MQADALERDVEGALATLKNLLILLGSVLVDGPDARARKEVMRLIEQGKLPGLADVAGGIVIPESVDDCDFRHLLGGEEELLGLTVVAFHVRLGCVASFENGV